MDGFFAVFGGRKMFIGIISVVGIFVLAGIGKVPAEQAVKWVTALVVGTSASIAVEDGLAQVGSKQKQSTRKGT